jgi:hypothetical protein
MQRRKIIKYLALSIGGAITLPAWANHWQPQDVSSKSYFLMPDQANTLAELAETLIPTTDTPGAKTLAIPAFIEKMVADCYDKNAQTIFKQGFELLDNFTKQKFQKSFVDCAANQRTEILQMLEKEPDSDLKKFYKLVKNLTIRGYTSSEFVMTNYYKYTLVPGKYKSCVEVGK